MLRRPLRPSPSSRMRRRRRSPIRATLPATLPATPGATRTIRRRSSARTCRSTRRRCSSGQYAAPTYSAPASEAPATAPAAPAGDKPAAPASTKPEQTSAPPRRRPETSRRRPRHPPRPRRSRLLPSPRPSSPRPEQGPELANSRSCGRSPGWSRLPAASALERSQDALRRDSSLEFPAVFLSARRLQQQAHLEHATRCWRHPWSRREDLPRALDFHSRVPLHILRALAAVVSRYAHRSGLVSDATSARRWVPGPAEDPRVYSVMVQHPDSSDALSLADPASLTDRASVPNFAAERERTEWLIKTLGERACRKLGIYRIPEDFVLSVVIPVYNEKNTIHEILTPGPRRADQEADHRRRRLLEGRHPRDPPRAGRAATPT